MTQRTSEYNLRNFVLGDEAAIVALFNTSYSEFAGFVPRTIDYWTWFCLNRPGIAEKGIMIAEKAGKIVGYAVVAKSGDVLEICYDRKEQGRQAIVDALVSRASEYATSLGCDSVVINAPVSDETFRRVCVQHHFVETPPELVFIGPLDMQHLISQIIKNKHPGKLRGKFLFKIRKCPPWCDKSFVINLEKDATVVKQEMGPTDLTIEVDNQTLLSIVIGSQNPIKALSSFKISFHPFWRFSKFLALMLLIQVKSSWYMPIADNG